MDALGELNDQTPRIRISEQSPPSTDVIFGLDTKLFEKKGDEEAFWKAKGDEGGWHGDEVETRTVWRGGAGGKRKRAEEQAHEREHTEGDCGCEGDNAGADDGGISGEVVPVETDVLEASLRKLNFEIYRGESTCLSFLAKSDDDQHLFARLTITAGRDHCTSPRSPAFFRSSELWRRVLISSQRDSPPQDE